MNEDKKYGQIDGYNDNIAADQLEKLKQVLPEVFDEGDLNWGKLRATLGKHANLNEQYGLCWKGKSDVFAKIQEKTVSTLHPQPDISKDWDTTKNLFIEGDNLEALKILHKSYYGKVKMIYIDPPYNTGNDFVYNDDFKQTVSSYNQEVGLTDDEGNATRNDGLRVNTGGHRHSNWLTMMYPRLFLARNLLRQDGVIFVSIDDNEVHNLRLMMNEVFGEENFVAQVVVASNSAKNNSKYMSINHEYALVYARSLEENEGNWLVPKNNVNEFASRAKQLVARNLSSEEIHQELLELVKYPRFYDFDHYTYADSNGVYQLDNPGGVAHGNKETVIRHPISRKPVPIPKGGWRYKESELLKLLDEDKLEFGADEGVIPRIKRYLHEYLYQIPKSTVFFDSQSSTKWLKSQGILFDFPKAIEFVKFLISVDTSSNDIVLDFFAGSGTTAHAVMQLNAEDGGNRRYVCVQLPELTAEKSEAYKAGYKNIADIARERIRRAGEKIKQDFADKLSERETSLDVGFRSYSVGSSNFKIWNELLASPEEIRQQALDHIDPLEPNATDDELLTELLLKKGISPLVDIENFDDFMFISSESLAISLTKNMTEELFAKMLAKNPSRILLLDRAFAHNLQLKTNLLLQAEKKGVKVEVM